MVLFRKRVLEPEKTTTEESSEKLAILLEDLTLLEDYIRDLFSFSPLPLCSLSPRGVILEVNPAFEELSGYKIYEIIGSPIERLFGKEKILEIAQETLEKGAVKTRELTLFTKDKGEVPVSIFSKARKSPEGEAVGYFLSFFDLTDTKETERELRTTQTAVLNILEDVDEARIKAEEEKDKTLAVITNFADGLIVFDREHKLSLINPQMEAFFDTKAAKVIGGSLSELSRSSILKPLIDLIKIKRDTEIKRVRREELPLKETLILEISTVPMIRGGEELGTLVIAHDITREKRIEQLKTEFVSLSAHQLRTPLSAIKWTLRMLLDGDLGEITAEQRDYTEKTAQSTERMIALINDLLNVTRIEEGKYLYEPVPLLLTPIVQSVIDSYKEEIKQKKIKFKFSKPKELPPIRLDKEKIRLAIQNIFDNAVRYTPAGGEVKVSLKYDKNKQKVEFSVKDSGIGIPQDQQERVFTKFFRGGNAIRMATEGSGLGLYITKHIVEAHGGRIWFISEANKGSTFSFTLPVKGVGKKR